MDNFQKWLSRKFILYKFFTNLWFVGAVWLFFYRQYINDAQIGILDGVAFAIGLLAEVPSGALADRFGRDKMVRIGQILTGSGLIIQAFGQGLTQLILGQAIMMVGVSFVSGADEALFFDQLKFEEKSSNWRKLLTKGSQIALIGSTFATVFGGWVQGIDPRIPWLLTGTSFLISAAIIWPIKDSRTRDDMKKISIELKNYLKSIKLGFSEFLNRRLSLYLPIIIIVQGLFYAAGWGLLKVVLMDRFHFSPLAGSIVVAICSLITVAILGYMHKHAESLSEKNVLTLISILAGLSLLLSIANIGWFGFFVILILYAGEHILVPFMSEVINYRTEENQRATVLSVASFLRTLPYIALAPIIGGLNSINKLEYFLIAWAVLIMIALFVYRSLKKNDIKISFVKEGSIDERIPEVPTE